MLDAKTTNFEEEFALMGAQMYGEEQPDRGPPEVAEL
jgi:hypothetical protein